MIIRKVRGEDRIEKIIMSRIEYESCKRHGVSVDVYIKQMLRMIAKKRRWKWYLNKEKNHE